MSNLVEIKVPDLGDFKDIPVIEILVKPGDLIKQEDSVVSLESDKATMEVPASHGGVVTALKVNLGDKVSQGSVIAIVDTDLQGKAASAVASQPPTPVATPTSASAVASQPPTPVATPTSASAVASPAPAPNPSPTAPPQAPAPKAAPAAVPGQAAQNSANTAHVHASPSIRKLAREFGVDLSRVKGSGNKGRITEIDVKTFVKTELAKPAASSTGGFALPTQPMIDFSKFGEIETRALSRIKKLSGANLHRNWVSIPHVTQHDEADITDTEAFRSKTNDDIAKTGVKVTMLAFLIKASVAALKKYPEFNASLESGGENLILKKYFHIGFAADTPNGLVVPVVKNADQKSVIDLARETSELAARAREGKLSPTDMQGGCFSISSLGGIGGSTFTPIINAPEVAILGVSKSAMKPVWNGQTFEPRLILPLSLSYDHRVIDGAAAARFTTTLAGLMSDIRKLLL